VATATAAPPTSRADATEQVYAYFFAFSRETVSPVVALAR
jgi:hypothetical protein